MKRNRSLAILLVALMVFAILGTACGKKAATPAPAPNNPPAAAPAFSVGMVTDIGGLNDQSFNASAYRGLKKLETDKISSIKVIESTKPEDYDVNLSALMDQKMNLIWSIGFMMGDATDKAAKANPNQQLAIIDFVVNQPNVASVTFKEEEGSFLEGVIAGLVTKTNKIGFIGGMEGDLIGKFESGFRAGVKAVNPKAEVIVNYAGSFTDQAKGKEIALAQYGAGADVIYHAAGAVGIGVIAAAKERNKYVIGVDSDQNYLAPDNVISSMVKGVDVAVYDISKREANGEKLGGQHIILGLKEGGVGPSPSTKWNLVPGLQDKVNAYAKLITDGTMKVPATRAEVDAFKAPEVK